MTEIANTATRHFAAHPLGVVVVTHNSAHVLRTCLDSLRPYNLPVVVVDNASLDTTGKLPPASISPWSPTRRTGALPRRPIRELRHSTRPLSSCSIRTLFSARRRRPSWVPSPNRKSARWRQRSWEKTAIPNTRSNSGVFPHP